MPPKSQRELRSWNGQEGGGEKKLTQLVTIHTACGGVAGKGMGGGRKSISLPAFIEMHLHFQSVELSVCVG